jgi:NADH:ubiquinone oxidoreductase subunit H
MMVSYELILSSAVLVVVFLTASFSYFDLIETQESI